MRGSEEFSTKESARYERLQLRVGVDVAARLLRLSQTTFWSLDTLIDAWDQVRIHYRTDEETWQLVQAALEIRVRPADLHRVLQGYGGLR